MICLNCLLPMDRLTNGKRIGVKQGKVITIADTYRCYKCDAEVAQLGSTPQLYTNDDLWDKVIDLKGDSNG